MDKFSPIPLYIQLKNDLLHKIKTGIWDIGEQIPTELELMKQNDIGRETVRKAVAILVQEGYLYKKRGIGTFVANRKPAIGFEPLISLSHALQIRGLKGKNEILEEKSFVPDENLKKQLKWQDKLKCHYIKRLRYVEGKPLALEHSYFQDKKDKNNITYNFEGSISKYFLQELKIKIKKIEQVITPRKPKQEESDLLQIDNNEIVLDLERWIYTEGSNSVYYYVQFIIPADLYSYSF